MTAPSPTSPDPDRAPDGPSGSEAGRPRAPPPDAGGTPLRPPAPEGAAPCPFCGGVGLPKRPWGDRISGSSIGTDVASLRLVVDSSGEEYFKCHGCNTSFVFADREIGTILPGLRMRPRVPLLAKHYYGDGVSVHDLLTRHRTAIVRKIHGRLSFISARTARNELVVCLNYNGVRTFGSLRRRRGRNGYYYELRGLDRA